MSTICCTRAGLGAWGAAAVARPAAALALEEAGPSVQEVMMEMTELCSRGMDAILGCAHKGSTADRRVLCTGVQRSQRGL